VSNDNPNGSPTGASASPPPSGYPGAAAPQTPYGAPAYPQPPQQQPYGYGAPYGYAPKTNSLAIVSLISGIAAFVVLPFIASIVAVITGHMSLKQLKTNGEAGRGMALAGTILGWVGIGLAVLLVVGLIVFWGIIAAGLASSGSSYYDYS